MWAMTGIAGYIYDFKVQGGLGTKHPPNGYDPPDSCGESRFLVLKLSKDLQPGNIFFIRKNIFACLFSVHNRISLSLHEQVCIMRLRFMT